MKGVMTICVLAACGGSSDPTATPDAPAPVQPGGPVTISVTVAGQPQPNVEVMFQNADSVVVAAVVTDAAGLASGNVEQDGYVTVIEPRPLPMSRDRLSTFAGVQPGDELHLDLAPPAPPVVAETFLLRFTPDSPSSGHFVRTSCGEPSSTGGEVPDEFSLFGCNGVADFLVIAIDDTGLGFRSHFHRDEPLDDVDLTAGVYADFVPSAVTFAALPQDTSFVGVYRALVTTRGLVFDVTGGTDTLGTTLQLPAGFDQREVVMTSTTPFPPPGAFGQHTVIEWDPFTEVDYALRVADSQVLPFSALPAYDLASRTASWTESPTGVAPNYVQVSLNVYRDDIPEGRGWDWRMVAPRTGTSCVYPALPLDRNAFDFNVIENDVVSVHDLITAKLPAGYDDKMTRERAFADLKGQIAGETGELSIQTLSIPGEPEL